MKFYIPLRCPNCGESQFTKVQRSDYGDNASQYPETSFEIKWCKCNTCSEIVPIPRSHIIKE
jgi:hypothetical protein